jgi:hypothetical protein
MEEKSYVQASEIIQVSSFGDGLLIPLLQASSNRDGNFSGLQKVYVVAKNALPNSGKLTITPVVTTGTGTATDFTLMYQITGNIIDVSGFCREYEIADGDDVLTVQLDLTGTPLEPVADFTGAFQLTGGATFAEHSQGTGADVLQSISINTVTSTKKLQIAVTLEAPLSGDTFNTSLSFSIKFERVVIP